MSFPAKAGLIAILMPAKARTTMTDKGRKETIEGVKVTDKHVFLHGRQDEEAWSAVISLESGVLTGSISAVGTVFVLFGNCAPK